MLTLANQGGKYAAGRLTAAAVSAPVALPADPTARYLLSEVLLIVADGPPTPERRTAEGAALRALLNYQSGGAVRWHTEATPPPLTEAERIAARALLGGTARCGAHPLPATPGTISQFTGQARIVCPQEG